MNILVSERLTREKINNQEGEKKKSSSGGICSKICIKTAPYRVQLLRAADSTHNTQSIQMWTRSFKHNRYFWLFFLSSFWLFYSCKPWENNICSVVCYTPRHKLLPPFSIDITMQESPCFVFVTKKKGAIFWPHQRKYLFGSYFSSSSSLLQQVLAKREYFEGFIFSSF